MNNFRFSSEPFTREIRIENRLTVPHLDTELKKLKEVVEARQSAAIVAPAGSGKSLIIRSLKATLPEARYRVSYLKLASLSLRDMCRYLATAIGASPAGHFPGLIKNIEDHIRSGFDGGIRPVILLDDAHEMRPEVLRILRVLTNFDMDSRLIVSFILCGQTPLKQILLRPDMEDILQRLAYCGELRLLNREETKAYISHRCIIAGLREPPFDPAALDAIYEITHGNMRAIDKIALASLSVTDSKGRSLVEVSDVAEARAKSWM
jgi:type II secretory pathway predicted ATPase ExeA